MTQDNSVNVMTAEPPYFQPGQVYPDQYDLLFETKCTQILEQLDELKLTDTVQTIETFASSPKNYRARVEFSIASNPWRYVMFDHAKNPVDLNHCPLALSAIDEAMPVLLEFLTQHPEFGHRLFQTNWRANQQGDVLVSLLYHRDLEPQWIQLAEQLEQLIGGHVIGRARKKRHIVSQDYIDVSWSIGGRNLVLREHDNCFSQPNATINPCMLNWVEQQLNQRATQQTDLLELYCGIGNFTSILAPQFRKVLATELTRQSIRLCQHNMAENGINNVDIVRLSAQETVAAITQQRPFRRLKNIALSDYHFDWLFIDPPRQGLDDDNRRFFQKFNHIIYISCNPLKLIKDLQYWQNSHQIEALAIFDQFPYTEHLEIGVILKIKPLKKD